MPESSPSYLLGAEEKWPCMRACAHCEQKKGTLMCSACRVTRCGSLRVKCCTELTAPQILQVSKG
jgi:hypothetical protein